MTVTREAFSAACLVKIAKPTDTNNLMSCVCWIESENSDALWDPFDTEQSEPGSTNFNKQGVKNFTSMAEGVEAFATTILNGRYAAILKDFENSEPMAVTCSDICNSAWGSKPTSALQATVAKNYSYFANLPIAGSTEGDTVPNPLPVIENDPNAVPVDGLPASPAANKPVESATGQMLAAPIVGGFPVSGGFVAVAADGGVFTVGKGVSFYGSLSGTKLNQPIVAAWPSPSGKGYTLLAADGGTFNFGDASAPAV